MKRLARAAALLFLASTAGCPDSEHEWTCPDLASRCEGSCLPFGGYRLDTAAGCWRPTGVLSCRGYGSPLLSEEWSCYVERSTGAIVVASRQVSSEEYRACTAAERPGPFPNCQGEDAGADGG